MQKDIHNEIFTIGVGGAAGDGVMEAGSNIGLLLQDLGFEVYLSTSYPSLIRGGHNFVRISFSKEKVWSDYQKLDVLIALNGETVKLHRDELSKDAVVFADEFSYLNIESSNADIDEFGEDIVVAPHFVPVPMLKSVKDFSAPVITRNSVALGALCYLLDLPFSKMEEILKIVFKDKKPDINLKLAKTGFEHLASQCRDCLAPAAVQDVRSRMKEIFNIGQLRHGDAELIDGNTAFAKGLQSAGLDFYIAYPMTPSSTILHYLASQTHFANASQDKQKENNLKVIQPENEIAVINMALGMAYAGKRVAVGSATGGFALMQEAFSFAGMAELPLVVAVSQRQAPATGAPTHSSQSDLRFAVHSGHGEFPRVCLAPGDSEECFRFGWQALNLAWKFQIPVIVLLDKILSEHMMTVSMDKDSAHIDRGWLAEKADENYERYKFTENGISPMAFPGTKNVVVKVTSYEHDEKGLTTEKSEEIKKMLDKRFLKWKGLEEDMRGRETVRVFGDSQAENVIVFFGSTKSAVLEASKYFEKPVKLLQIIWLEPFDTEKVKKELEGKKRIICVEGNHNGQLAGLIAEKTGIEVTEKVLKYDSTPFDVGELSERINQLLVTSEIQNVLLITNH